MGLPYGAERWPNDGAMPTDYRWTGQRSEASLGLYHMGARFYDPALGRWLSADTLVPEPGSPQAFNRYSYVTNRPLNRIDPSGHQDIPPVPEWVHDVIKFLEEQGWQIVGNVEEIHPNWNGADLVFIRGMGEQMEVLAAELKDVGRRITPSVLGRSKAGDLGGSKERLARSSLRFYNSSKDQPRLMCRTVRDAFSNGTLTNALFTSGADVNEKAQEVFSGVYQMKDGQVNAVKASEKIERPGFWEQIGTGASTALSAVKAAAVELTTNLASTEVSVPFFYLPPAAIRRVWQPPGYYEVQN